MFFFSIEKIQAAPLIYKKASVFSKLISLGSYLIKLVTLFLRIEGNKYQNFLNFISTLGGRALS